MKNIYIIIIISLLITCCSLVLEDKESVKIATESNTNFQDIYSFVWR